ncbi:contact-dependent growth inhibition system immunity protein [Niveibacterium sp. SC-1]|uniref:contact-dependent growth inhibition system immunity protein n=1 Tax=Niveibacterium sp. SC-1 TaxID=3135646 RepID=UPI00311FF2E5
MNTSRTIEQLEAAPWPQPPTGAPDFVRRCHSLRRLPINRLAAGDLRILIAQDIALKHLIPLALPLLKTNPLLEAEYYPGDLLSAAMNVAPAFWKASPSERAELVGAVEEAQARISDHGDSTQFRQISKEIARFLETGETAR